MVQKSTNAAAWSYTVGMLPHRVQAYEDTARRGVVYLKHRRAGEWKRKSLGFTVRDEKGRLDKAAVKRAQADADALYARLVHGGHIVAPAVVADLTIAQGWARATDAETGKWTADTQHRREMGRAIDRAKSVWGAQATWNAIGRGELRKLWRAELKRVQAQGGTGVRMAEIVIARVLALAAWLRDEQLIAPTACLPWKAMKDEMRGDGERAIGGRYVVARPRYSLEQYRALLASSHKVDPRWHLLVTIGAEYRLGQVVRVHRTDIDRANGTVTVQGAGKKRGVVIALTAGQRTALEEAMETGYLAPVEAAFLAGEVPNYPVFVGGKIRRDDGTIAMEAKHADRSHLDNTQLRKWHRRNEQVARVDGKPIPHVKGLGWYGMRRQSVDAAKAEGITREGLQQHGGWSDTQVPDAIYADQNATYAREEAARVRATIRGEILHETEQNGRSTENGTLTAGAGVPSK